MYLFYHHQIQHNNNAICPTPRLDPVGIASTGE
jgi:hypothetical protein